LLAKLPTSIDAARSRVLANAYEYKGIYAVLSLLLLHFCSVTLVCSMGEFISLALAIKQKLLVVLCLSF